MSKLEIIKTNKFDDQWEARTLFSSFNIRATLKKEEDILSSFQTIGLLKKKLAKDIGPEDDDWFISGNPMDGFYLYLKDTSILILWKMKSFDNFNEVIESVEQHDS